MKKKNLRIFLMVGAWCATSGASYWVGFHNSQAGKISTAPNHGKVLTDHGPVIVLNGSNNSKAPTLQDLLHSKGKPDADALKAWADSLDPSECASILADLEKMPGGQPRDALIEAMIGSWAARDPQSYLADYAKVSNPRVRENGVADALQAMAAKDPQAAIAWMSASSDALPNQELSRIYRAAITGMASNDPQAALDYVKGLDTGSLANQRIQNQGLNTIADTLASQGRFSDALQMFAGLSDAQRGTATNELMTQWAQYAPADATTYIATVTDPAQRGQLAGQVATSWARNDPQAAAVWAAQFDQSATDASGAPSGQVLADAVRSWSRYDLNGPGQFLNTLTPSAATDPAMVTFTMQSRTVDPSTAMTWSSQITDPAMREKVTGSVALQMLASGNTDALNQAISTNQLTPDQVQWLSGLPTDNPQQLNRMARRMGTNFATNPNRTAPWSTAPAQGGGPQGGGPQGGGPGGGRGGFGGAGG